MKNLFFISLFLFHLSSSFSQQQKFSQADSLRGYLSKERKCFDVYYYDLFLNIDIPKHFISGNNTIYYTATEDFSVLQLDLDLSMKIEKITDAKDNIISHSRTANSIFVSFNSVQKKGSQSFIKIFYSGEPHPATNPPWDGGFVWRLDSLDRPWVSVACEGIGASIWWPCKDHPSDEPDSVRMQFEVPKNLFCASNGNLISTKTTNTNTTIFEWKVSYPINIYNVTLNIGNYTHISDFYDRKGKSRIALDYYVLSYNEEKAKKHFEQVKPMLECYEKLFGNYPFEKDGYALIESSYWGMEHQSAIAYGNRFKNNMVGMDYIIVHESGHEWWGNNVSIADHADLWIHEAFTTYGETLLLECLSSKEVAEKYLFSQKKLIRNKEPIVGPEGVNYHYWDDSDMYYKGAWMLHTLRSSLDNDSLWFALLLGIQKEFGGKQTSTSKMIDYVNTFTKFDYQPFFHQYLNTTEIPELEYQLVRKDKKHSILKYRWRTEEETFSLPLVIFINEGQKIKIFPNSEFKTLELPCSNGKTEVDFNTKSFYILLKQLKLSKK